ncbi:hypothetical protein OSB04_016214 [Centaurea solstitialis]|uniref:Uncharacterized protein n=1 Tax=Centaurea solstitialis TaxID=347529 RepID=A0AA38WJH5_9ASTR|nr:hypothetical protein OSB04_016214 [Centaurea solstitialis]
MWSIYEMYWKFYTKNVMWEQERTAALGILRSWLSEALVLASREKVEDMTGRQKNYADKVMSDLEFDLGKKDQALRDEDVGLGDDRRKHRKGSN